jgi:hypothetical protein
MQSVRRSLIVWLRALMQGVIITGSRGLRKLRIALAGRGKRGGGRIIYWYYSPGFPAVPLWVFAKNEADDLTAAQLKRLINETDGLIDDFGGTG